MDREYESDHTRFMRELMAANPGWAEEQKSGRALWWDRHQDKDTTQRQRDSREPNKAYPYDVNFD